MTVNSTLMWIYFYLTITKIDKKINEIFSIGCQRPCILSVIINYFICTFIFFPEFHITEENIYNLKTIFNQQSEVVD